MMNANIKVRRMNEKRIITTFQINHFCVDINRIFDFYMLRNCKSMIIKRISVEIFEISTFYYTDRENKIN